MPVFFVHEPGRGIVTPLDRKFKIRDIPPTSELEEITPIHPRNQPDTYHPQQADKDQAKESRREPSTQHSADARKAYAEMETPDRLRLGTVNQFMSHSVITIDRNAYLDEAWALMERNSIRHLVIIDNTGQLCGLLSEKKLLSYLMQHPGRYPDAIPVNDFCEEQVLSTGMETDIVELAQAMMEHDLGGIPVTDQGALTGIITRSDVMKIILRSTPFDTRA